MSEEDNGLIKSEDYKVDVRKSPLEGSESRVYKGYNINGESIALKIYPKRHGLPEVFKKQLVTYQELTNRLAERHNNKGEYIEITINGEKKKYLIYIVPITTVGDTLSSPTDHDSICPCSVSPFIEGRSLQDIEPHYISSRFGKLEDDPLVKLGKQYREETQFDGISIIPWNVKPLDDNDPPVLAITDITGSVRDIKKRQS